MFNILVYERRLRHREVRNKGNLMRGFDTRDLVALKKQVKSSRKYVIAQILVFKTKIPYRDLEKDTQSSCWIQSLASCEGVGRPRRKLKESASSL